MVGLSPGKAELVMAETVSTWLGSSSAGKALGGPGGQRAERGQQQGSTASWAVSAGAWPGNQRQKLSPSTQYASLRPPIK